MLDQSNTSRVLRNISNYTNYEYENGLSFVFNRDKSYGMVSHSSEEFNISSFKFLFFQIVYVFENHGEVIDVF